MPKPRPHSRILLCFNTPVMYAVAAAIRPHVDYLAVAVPEPPRGQPKQAGLAASRLFDAVVHIPHPPYSEWSLDTVSPGEQETTWIDHVVAVARSLDLRAVVTVNDAELFFLTRHRERLASIGLDVLAPHHEVVTSLHDKHLVGHLAASHGLNTAPTVPVAPGATLDELIDEVGLPLVFKRRYSAGSANVHVAHSREAVVDVLKRNPEIAAGSDWLVQRYIEGAVQPSATVLMGGSGESILEMYHVKHRYLGPSASTAVEIVDPFVPEGALASMFSALGACGPFTVQFKLDANDGKPSLIEVNPPLGQNTRLIFPLLKKFGHDPGKLLLDSFNGDHRGPTPVRLPRGSIGLSPADDLMSLAVWKRARTEQDRSASIPSFPRYLASIAATYVRPAIAMDTLFRRMLLEPRVVLHTYSRQLGMIKSRQLDLIPWCANPHRAITESKSR